MEDTASDQSRQTSPNLRVMVWTRLSRMRASPELSCFSFSSAMRCSASRVSLILAFVRSTSGPSALDSFASSSSSTDMVRWFVMRSIFRVARCTA